MRARRRVIIDGTDDGAKTMRDRIVRENLDGIGNDITATRVLVLTLMRQLTCRRGLMSRDARGQRIRLLISWRASCRVCFDSWLFSHSTISFHLPLPVSFLSWLRVIFVSSAQHGLAKGWTEFDFTEMELRLGLWASILSRIISKNNMI